MKQLFLADLEGLTEEEIHRHIANSYEEALELVKEYKILIAYESVGDYGCDSSSFFLLEKDGLLYENHGSHCSCYGFENQFSPEETTVQYLKEKFTLPIGGYDYDNAKNKKLVKEYIDKEF